MLNALSAFFGGSQSNEQQVTKLENQIKDIEVDIDPKGKHIKHKSLETLRIVCSTLVAAPLGSVTLGALPYVGGGLGALGLAAIFGVAAFFTGDFNLAKKRKNGIAKINALSEDLVRKKFQLIKDARPGTVIDFVFNREPTIEIIDETISEPEQNTQNKKAVTNKSKKVNDKTIEPIKLEDSLVGELMAVLRSQSLRKDRVKLRKIDISRASLQSEALNDLLTAGLGKFDTEHLCLKCDKHSEKTIKILKTHIVDKKDAFQKLKTLDLSGNKLNGACLEDIKKIVNHLQLQELNLTDNEELGSKFTPEKVLVSESVKPLQEFLKQKRPRMLNLKKLHMKNIGIQEEHGPEIGIFLRKSLQLQFLDIRANKLSYTELTDSVKMQGIKTNVSLEELLTDHDAYFESKEIFEKRDDALTKCSDDKEDGTSWALHLINSKLSKSKLPTEVSKYLAKTSLNDAKLCEIIGAISQARLDYLGVKKEIKAPISEIELYSYYAETLPDLYKSVRDGKAKHEIDKELVKNINKISVRRTTSRTPARTPNKPASRSAKSVPAALQHNAKNLRVSPRGSMTVKKAPPKNTTPKKVINEVATTSPSHSRAPMLTKFDSVRNIGLRNEIEQSLSKAMVERNPMLSKQAGLIQTKANRFRV
jgi:hypothetical protein